MPIASLDDMHALFDGIPIEQMNTSMTINGTAMWLLSLYIALAEERGASVAELQGTTQNDIIKEYLARAVRPARYRGGSRKSFVRLALSSLMFDSLLVTPKLGRRACAVTGEDRGSPKGYQIQSGPVTERPSLFEFGPYRLDARRRLVWRQGVLLEVPPRVVDLLAALVGEAGEVVPKEELLRRVWPDTFVEEANLSVNVSILRKALGDQPDGHPWIQTVARRGYRFVGAVRAQPDTPGSLAVLPFRSMGDDEALLALGLGMADALITRLAA